VRKSALLLIAAAGGWSVLTAQQRAPFSPEDHAAAQVVGAIDSSRMRTFLSALAHDSMEGRAPGTPGGRRAAEYIAARFRDLGLSPAGDRNGYFQDFSYRIERSEGRAEARLGSNGPGSIRARNVVASLPGTGPNADQFVIIGAHFDAYGIGRASNGDSIYNGAEDNAAGVAQLLAIAESFVRSGGRPRRSIMFVGFDAEEPGLLGAEAFVDRPPVPLKKQVAMINLDAANLYGPTRDAAALGLKESTLDESFRRAAQAEGMVVPAEQPDSIEAFFLRSDQLPFARAGVPAIFVFVGWDFVGRTPEWASRMWSNYFENHYHRPSDQLQDYFSMAGALQQARVVARVALEVANSPDRPRWRESSRFFRR
jgi:hypothetical protein